jgi:uncharacterized membrane protein AbrB (regulator of aidB expression)
MAFNALMVVLATMAGSVAPGGLSNDFLQALNVTADATIIIVVNNLKILFIVFILKSLLRVFIY